MERGKGGGEWRDGLYGLGRGGRGREAAGFLADVGDGERERERDSNSNPSVAGCTREWEEWGWWVATWARGAEWGAEGGGGGRRGRLGGCRLGERRREVEEGADRWAPPVGDPEGLGRREESAWAGPAEGRPAREANGLGRRPKKREKRRTTKKKKRFSRDLYIAHAHF